MDLQNEHHINWESIKIIRTTNRANDFQSYLKYILNQKFILKGFICSCFCQKFHDKKENTSAAYFFKPMPVVSW